MLAQKNILITGGAGFIGSNFICYFMNKYPKYRIINLDKLTYAADINNLKEVNDNPFYSFVEGDIRDQKLVEDIFDKHDVNGVIHFAAESHVDNSINSPKAFIESNILGTFNLLEAARKRCDDPEFRFHHVSTDEVYGSLGVDGYFTEASPYDPSSPYSASKASSNMLAKSYASTYGMNITISNCSNNYGPKQHKEKLIPKIINTALLGDDIPIYGDGKNVRDWIYVEDHCRAIDLIFHNAEMGGVYNIGGENEIDNVSLANKICILLDKLAPKGGDSYSRQIVFVEDRAGHDYRYAINNDKIRKKLGWSPSNNFEELLISTIKYYL